MGWFRVDDKFHAHSKPRQAGKAAVGVWILAGTWSMDNDTDGFVPADVLKTWGSAADARKLVAVGLWREGEHKGEAGWWFHDWSHFQPSAAVTAARKAAEREAGIRGNHRRWHLDRGVSDPDCEYCHRVPDGPPDRDPDDLPESGGESAPIRPVPVPVPDREPNGSLKRPGAEIEAVRDDVERVCEHLADRIEANGSKRPSIVKGWRTAARLMLDNDGRSEADVIAAIDWCQADPFWRSNILGMPKLREKYDQLRLASLQRVAGTVNGSPRQASDQAMWDRAYARADAREAGTQ